MRCNKCWVNNRNIIDNFISEGSHFRNSENGQFCYGLVEDNGVKMEVNGILRGKLCQCVPTVLAWCCGDGWPVCVIPALSPASLLASLHSPIPHSQQMSSMNSVKHYKPVGHWWAQRGVEGERDQRSGRRHCSLIPMHLCLSRHGPKCRTNSGVKLPSHHLRTPTALYITKKFHYGKSHRNGPKVPGINCITDYYILIHFSRKTFVCIYLSNTLTIYFCMTIFHVF